MSRYAYFAISQGTTVADADMSEVVVVDNMAALAEWARKRLLEAAEATSPIETTTVYHRPARVGIAYSNQPTVVRLSVEVWRITMAGSLAWADCMRRDGKHILATFNK